MWIDRKTYERLLSEAAQLKPLQNALAMAEERAMSAEDALAVERNRKDWLVEQLTSRVLTKQKVYGLDSEPHPVEPAVQPPFEPTEIDLAKLKYYKECALAAGKSEEDAQARWEEEMRTGNLPMESETEQ